MNKRISTIFLILYILVEILSFFNFTFFNYFNKVNVFFSLFVFLVVFVCNLSLFSKKSISFLTILTLLMMLSVFLNNGTIGSVVNIICLIMGITIFSKIKIPKVYYKYVTFIFLLILLYYLYKSKDILYTTKYFKNTDFNSNTIAQVILYINMFLFLLFSKYKWDIKMLYFLIIPISLIGIINTQSRGAALSYVLFIFIFTFRNFKIIKRKSGLLITLLAIAGTFFPIVYLNLYRNGVNFVIPYMNKSLYTGREVLWLYTYEKLTASVFNIIVGLGANFVIEGQEVLNLHNMFFALIVNFGIIIFAVIIVWFHYFIKNNIAERYKYCIMPIVLLSFFETTILWNAILIFVLLIESLIIDENIDNKIEGEKI